tara:strand:- start:3 stop:728 length:726 start_codon:yes stop_codon:yes gene_type:complete
MQVALLSLPLAAASLVWYDPLLSVVARPGGEQHRASITLCKAADKKKKGAAPPKGFRGFGSDAAAAAATAKKRIQEKPVAKKHPSTPEWRSFENWLLAKGATLNGVELADCGGGLRGVRTTRRVTRGEELLRIPRSLILDTAQAESSGISSLWDDADALPQYAQLALLLMSEIRKGEHSPFSPYLTLLPSADDFIEEGGPTLLWTESELSMLECSKLQEESDARRAALTSAPPLQQAALSI